MSDRAALAAAVEKHRSVADRLARLQAAEAETMEAKWRAADALDRAEADLAEATEAAERAQFERAIGQIARAPSTAAAERAVAAARAEHQSASRLLAQIVAERPLAERAVDAARIDLNEAIAATVRGSAEACALADAYVEACARLNALRAALDALSFSARPESVANYQSVDFVERAGSDPALAEAWSTALKALEISHDARLPTPELRGAATSPRGAVKRASDRRRQQHPQHPDAVFS